MSTGGAVLQVEQLLEHLEWMRRLARALTHGDAAEADDLTSEAVQAALEKPPVLEGPARLWLAGVLRNLARMRARSGVRRRDHEHAAAADAAGGDARQDLPPPSPVELVERLQAQRRVAALVVELAEPYRSTVLLRYHEGLSAAEVARRLGVPAGTVRWRLKEGLGRLRAALDDTHGGDRQRWSVLLLPMPALRPPTVSPPQSIAEPRTSLIVKGALIMTAKTKLLTVAAVLAVLVGGTVGLGLRGRAEHGTTGAARPVGAGEALARPRRARVSAALRFGPGGASLVAVETPDAAGGLRLEGQVIDEQESPLADAAVAIDTNPPRVVLTRADGGFVLDKLMPRLYRLEARAGDLYAGPAETRLSRGSEPLVLRARAGRRVRVEVRAASDGAPIAGAQVTLRSSLAWEGRTDERGVVVLTGVASDWLQLRADAVGFAPAHRVLAGGPGGETAAEVRLSRGAPAAGRVRDAAGAPVEGALVWASLTSEPFPALDPRLDAVTTDAAGRWRMDALAAGTYRFEASHPDHAQGSSAATVIDGVGAREGLDIALPDGGVLGGAVRRPDGSPVAAAQVRAAVQGGVAWRFMRDTFTDDAGRFRLTGLPRRALDVVALHDEASSPTMTVDLRAEGRTALTLTLSVDGAISGRVVDRRRSPVAEAQVIAEPERGADVTALREWDLRGSPRFITDAGGRFRLVGLPAGGYRLRAAPPGAGPEAASLHPGVRAAPGDHDVEIVVRGSGSLTGSVAYDDGGGAPARFSVAVGARSEAFSAPGGAFALEVPAGRHDALISGDTFTTTRVQDADVDEGQTTDLGVIKVKRGRGVSGRVLRADGSPVAGADVAAGWMLTGDGRKLNIAAEGGGVHESLTGDDGRFSMTGFDDSPLVVVAERDGVGRSRSVALPRGVASAEVDLVLEPIGSLEGSVSRAGKPLPGAVVIADPRGASSSHFFVIADGDGRFVFDMLAPGPYRVSALIGEGGSRPKDMFSDSVTVAEGRTANAHIAVPVGGLALTLALGTDEGGGVPAASIVVLSGALADSGPGAGTSLTMEALRDRFRTAPDGPAALILRDWRLPAPAPLRLSGLAPGTYAVCAVPIPADPGMPVAIERALEHGAALPARCVTRVFDSSSVTSEVALQVPEAWVRPSKK